MKPEATIYGLDPVAFVNLTLLGLLLLMVAFFVYVGYRTFKTERKRKEFIKDVKQGDKVYFPVMSGSVNAEVLEVNEDTVKVTLFVPKSRVYPNEKSI